MSLSASSTSEDVCQYLADQIKGSKVLMTGVSPGSIGAHAALHLSRHRPALLVLAGRTLSALQATEHAIKSETPDANTRLLILDLSSQESVRKAAAEVSEYPEGIDRIINSAGVMAAPYGLTREGVEMQFGINHIGHFLLTNLILPELMRKSGRVRVVNVSSLGHKRGPVRFEDPGFHNGKCYDKWQAYGQSKTANILFSVSLAEKLGGKGVESFSLYPGRIVTGIGRHLKPEEWVKTGWKHEDGSIVDDPKLNWRTPTQAAATLIVAAYDRTISDKNGSYMVNNQVNNDEAAGYALDPDNAERLWKLSEEIVGQKFEY
ncbi:NAD(P)-binding protein [Aspergillus ibericus CBS 121593]|uniref:NAD(P)-binding protein n=1 Tax=Aspergillus ibericus CBS 121593 TaxID=1448316 RepID=A0A395GV44_9EURO|nr:NAD(P)-binding protein [Aspergillus ibericus CBS 121593]RAK99431.1 NAD(P)-binding protein [Aspergillus ibericus CBS 121593]